MQLKMNSATTLCFIILQINLIMGAPPSTTSEIIFGKEFLSLLMKETTTARNLKFDSTVLSISISKSSDSQYRERSISYSSMHRQELARVYEKPEENYEIDEAVSVMSNGRTTHAHHQNDNHKVGYVVEGENYRKYRVEERTSDGFIVGEYGVVRHDDGSLRGVRYTADSTINPRLIYDALIKFLSL